MLSPRFCSCPSSTPLSNQYDLSNETYLQKPTVVVLRFMIGGTGMKRIHRNLQLVVTFHEHHNVLLHESLPMLERSSRDLNVVRNGNDVSIMCLCVCTTVAVVPTCLFRVLIESVCKWKRTRAHQSQKH